MTLLYTAGIAGYACLLLFFAGAIWINPQDPIEPPATAE